MLELLVELEVLELELELVAIVVSRLRLLNVALSSQTEKMINPMEIIATIILVMLELRFSINVDKNKLDF